MRKFYVTSAANMPGGVGYYELEAEDIFAARALAFAKCPDGRWSFMYTHLEEIHPLDRKLIKRFTTKPSTVEQFIELIDATERALRDLGTHPEAPVEIAEICANAAGLLNESKLNISLKASIKP